MFDPLNSELWPFFLMLLAAGTGAGLLAGMFGIGGGAVLVPVFYQVFGVLGVDDTVRMHLSVGTSIAIIVPTSLRSFLAHHGKGAVDIELLKSFRWAVPIGVVMASLIVAFVSSGVLRVIFACCSLVIAMKMLFGKDGWKIAENVPTGFPRHFAGWGIGFFSTLMGIGGGVFNNTFMTAFGRPIHQAVATSSGVGVLISIPGVLGYVWAGWGAPDLPAYSFGYVNLLLVLIIIPVTLLAAPIGVRMAHAMQKRHLEIGFGIFLTFVALRFFMSLI